MVVYHELLQTDSLNTEIHGRAENVNVWRVEMQSVKWEANPFQTIMVITETPEIDDAIKVARANVPSGTITDVKYLGSAYVQS